VAKQSNTHYSYTRTLTVGALEGDSLGLDDGETDGALLGLFEGDWLGAVGLFEGDWLGVVVGW